MPNLLTSSLSDSTLKQPVKCTMTLLWEAVVVLGNTIITYCLDDKRVLFFLI